jgi:hypothetical protein
MLNLPLTLTDTVLKPARIIKITRQDSTIFRIAEAQGDLVVDGSTYSPLGGFQLSAVKHQVGGEAASVQIDAAMSVGSAFDTYEVVDGKFDAATVEVYVINRLTLTSPALLFKGFIGPVRFGALYNSVSFDVRGYVVKAIWPFIQTFGPMCRTDFGSDLCRVPLRPSLLARNTVYVTRANATSVDHYAVRVSNGSSSDPDQYANVFFECTTPGTTHASVQPSFNFTVGQTTTDGTVVFTARDAWTRHAKIASIVDRFNIVLDRDPDPRGVTGWYNQGAIRMWDGYSETRAFEIGAWVLSTRKITLYLPIDAANNDTLIDAGDWLEIWPGCDFTINKCALTYANSEQFRGEPYFLGAAAVAQQNIFDSTGLTPTPTPGTWTPANLSSVDLWFDFSDSSTVTHVANAISQVNDKSGNAIHLTQATGAHKPTYVAAAQNGLSVARFDGINDNMSNTSLGGVVPGNNQTMLVVAKCTHTVTGWIYWNNNGGGTPTVAGVHLRGPNHCRMQGNSNNYAFYDPADNTWFVHTGIITPAIREVFENGTSMAGNMTTETVAAVPVEIWMGSDSNPVTFYGGDIGELVVCAGGLSTADRQKLEGYAAHKWGLTAGLPADHPYKFSGPNT